MKPIKWPENTAMEMENFSRLHGFPSIIGCVDGTHIRIQEPQDNPQAFINRKYFPSINVCAICNSSGKFTFVCVKWPGSCHDSFILRQTQIWTMFENGQLDGKILGDSAYPCHTWLLTPFIQPQSRSQMRYNRSHMGTRSRIECAFGRLKKRFRILHDEMRISKEKAPMIIMAAMILHNIAIDLNMPDFEEDMEMDNIENVNHEHNLNNGFEVRNHIVETFFQ